MKMQRTESMTDLGISPRFPKNPVTFSRLLTTAMVAIKTLSQPESTGQTKDVEVTKA
jgi:hypothetical protein